MTTNITPNEALEKIKEICKKYKYHTNVVMAIDDVATQALAPQEPQPTIYMLK